jgi:hypothetical protein
MSYVTRQMVEECFYGPLCTKCSARRTLSPSRLCSDYLGRRACPRCRTLGWHTGLSGYPVTCAPCEGTGALSKNKKVMT